MLGIQDTGRRVLRMKSGRGSLGHETGKVSVEDPNILYRRHESNVSIWPDDNNCTSITINPVCRISLSTSIERNADIVNENPRPSSRQS